MVAMQYKILLPDDYDMEIVRKKVKNNGHKTDGFQDLLFKAYLITCPKCGGIISTHDRECSECQEKMLISFQFVG